MSVSPEVDRLARQYRYPLVRYFQRRGASLEAAEDCTQEVFVRLAQRGLGGVTNAEAYLFSVAGSVIVDCARRAAVRLASQHDSIENLEIDGGEASPARVFEDRETLRRVAAALDELSHKTREIFLLNRMDALTYPQLAARFGVGVGAIEKHMTKALAHLRKRLRDE